MTAPLSLAPLPLAHLLLGLLLATWGLLFLARIVLSWYPQIDPNQGGLRWLGSVTEPLLAATRRVVPPIGGVDVSPVIWVGLVSLARELLVGQQGVVTQWMLHAQQLALS